MNQDLLTAFHQLDIRVGTVIEAKPFPEALKPAIKLWIDFGPQGVRKSSAQITERYTPEDLVGKQVLALLSITPRQIGNFMSECLVLGLQEESLKTVVLIQPEQQTPNGWKLA